MVKPEQFWCREPECIVYNVKYEDYSVKCIVLGLKFIVYIYSVEKWV